MYNLAGSLSEFLDKFTFYDLFIFPLVFHLTGVHTTYVLDPDREIVGLQKIFFQPFGPQFVLKIGGAPALPLIHHCTSEAT